MKPDPNRQLLTIGEFARQTRLTPKALRISDEIGPLEAILACPGDVQATDVIGIRTEPAHDEAFTTITKASGTIRRSSPPTTPSPARPRQSPVPEADCRAGRCT